MTLRAAADLHQGTEWTVLDILCRRLHTRPDGAVVSVACAQQESSEMTVDDNWNDKTLASVRRMAGVSYFCHHRSFRRLLFLVSKRCDRALSKRGWQIQFNTYGSLSAVCEIDSGVSILRSFDEVEYTSLASKAKVCAFCRSCLLVWRQQPKTSALCSQQSFEELEDDEESHTNHFACCSKQDRICWPRHHHCTIWNNSRRARLQMVNAI